MKITLNGEMTDLAESTTIAGLLERLGFDPARVAVERNLEVARRGTFAEIVLAEGDQVEVVHFIGGGAEAIDDPWVVAGRTFNSRLLVGTGKYKDFEETRQAIIASGAQIVTVAVRRVNVSDPKAPMLTDYLDPKIFTYLPNTAGCFTADDAVRTLRLAREAGGWDLVKLEVLSDPKYLWPNNPETLKAAELLIRDGFKVMVYTTDDPYLCQLFEQMGCVAVMPLAAPIGSGLGVRNPYTLRIIIEQARIPVLVDAGVGTASDAAIAMELGCDGVLMNTAIAGARDPIRMARAMRLAVQAGRDAFLSGRIPKKLYATASSPLEGMFFGPSN
ncbi:MAG: sulfur carrier protein ThiS [Magnetococcales bacterium]|nr:sulfur carrier protein ThiS [Magnetococcales bacterium]MBF0151930.1 sulfur carrier protein ThiS [Magnetococcales bacterium]MBF0172994.1 sulfur carrier protein ThiS [Magnetococcales bacterium]MBF0348967.1 sulfur carrier protein ThiS [Magnetococcales bacterium]MBF0631958.1 sulfur carrier protein ThiS [Magnetococcales bacterium]